MKATLVAEQCTARAKSTGQRCSRLVLGGGVCIMHGGRAPQVRIKREARILAAEAQLAAPVTAADAADVLTSAMNDAHSILQRIKISLDQGDLRASDLSALGDWIDRVTRVSKAVADSGIEERRVRLAEDQGRMVASMLQRILNSLLAGLMAEVFSDDTFARQRLTAYWGTSSKKIVLQELRALEAPDVRDA